MKQTITDRLRRSNQILFSKQDVFLGELAELLAALPRRAAVLWALELAGEITDALARRYPGDERPGIAVLAARQWAAGRIKMPAAKRAILDCHAMAKALADPADIALCHAVGQGCSVVHTTGHAMGLPLYELTAIVRQNAGEEWEAAVTRRIRAYAERAAYWEAHYGEYQGDWAKFL